MHILYLPRGSFIFIQKIGECLIFTKGTSVTKPKQYSKIYEYKILTSTVYLET